ncbi:MAG: GatB/YqeY domain-containing protein [bacterium]
MTLLERITQEYKQAMRDHDEVRKSVLNFLLAQIKNIVIDTRKDIEDDQVISLIKKEIKHIVETIGFLEKAQKPQSDIDVELQKKAILEVYLPQVLSREASQELISRLITELAITDIRTQR